MCIRDRTNCDPLSESPETKLSGNSIFFELSSAANKKLIEPKNIKNIKKYFIENISVYC